MRSPSDRDGAKRPSSEALRLDEYRLRVGGREWIVRHTGAILTHADEERFLNKRPIRPPFGVVLWPASIALAHEVASRGDAVRGQRVLELGAGTGLPGIVAASLGGWVVQSDRHELALAICKLNGRRNRVPIAEYRLADWSQWNYIERYEWILGSDILYGEGAHPHLRRIFDSNLALGGRVLIADPFRAASLRLLEAMEADGWAITVSKWSVGAEGTPRAIGVFELARPE